VIPHRVKLSGFLSYRAEQEISFEGAPLWMLAGRNGSGKSTIFDAVTYALFGHHRGGSQQVQELINKESNALAVEFDFAIDGQMYRVRRTAKRTAKGGPAGTQQISRGVPGADGQLAWEPVPDTNRKADFEAWVRDRIGLDYETFTSSVLLLQGKAEKLLDASPKGRAELLASIVDLERYQRLHAKADEQRKAFKTRSEQLEAQIANLPAVTDEQLAAVGERLLQAEEGLAGARADVERCRQREFEAKSWEELQARLGRLREQWQQANVLLGDAPSIEKDYARLSELKEVLPHANAIGQIGSDLEKSRERTRLLKAEREKIAAKRDERGHALGLARTKRAALEKQQAADEQRRQQVEARLRELSAIIERLRLYEEEQSRLTEVEARLSKLPADPSRVVHDAQERVDRTTESAAVSPHLERFAAGRADLGNHRRAKQAAKVQRDDLKRQGEEARKHQERAKAEHEAAQAAREQADARATEAQTLLHQARAALSELDEVRGESSCRRCGQPLTPAHIKEEKGKRAQELKVADASHREAARVQSEARAVAERALATLRNVDEELQRLREAYREAARACEQAAKDVERVNADCRRSYDALPARRKAQISTAVPDDWAATTYPTPDDLDALRRDVHAMDAHRRALKEADEAYRLWEKLAHQAENSRQSLARLRKELPSAKPAEVRAEHKGLQAEEVSLRNALAGAKSSLAENQREIDRVHEEQAAVEKSLGEIDRKLAAEEVERKNGEEAAERARRALPEKWRAMTRGAGLTDLHEWNVEVRALEEKQTAQRYELLARARMGLEGLRQDLAQEQARADAVPPEARASAAEVREALAAARRSDSDAEARLRAAQREKGLLDQNRELREKLAAEKLTADHELNCFKLLSELLGRDRLQRHLVRRAERQIVDHANAVLDRLSGGQLRLRLCGGDDGAAAERALELEAYNRVTGESPINVAFLSGSQRFRVAVSLALGIGQYASRQHRPIESVIIDEGFGCLDREGRQVMIQELQNLRGQLRCVLLVSHQEEFAEAFSDGYRFELEGGATKVTRFQK
jgi:exonuclease SbcC